MGSSSPRSFFSLCPTPLLALLLVLLLSLHPAASSLTTRRLSTRQASSLGAARAVQAARRNSLSADPQASLRVANDHMVQPEHQASGSSGAAVAFGGPAPTSGGGTADVASSVASPAGADGPAPVAGPVTTHTAPNCTANVPNCLNGYDASQQSYLHCMDGCRLNCKDKRVGTPAECSKDMKDGYPTTCHDECKIHNGGKAQP